MCYRSRNSILTVSSILGFHLVLRLSVLNYIRKAKTEDYWRDSRNIRECCLQYFKCPHFNWPQVHYTRLAFVNYEGSAMLPFWNVCSLACLGMRKTWCSNSDEERRGMKVGWKRGEEGASGGKPLLQRLLALFRNRSLLSRLFFIVT